MTKECERQQREEVASVKVRLKNNFIVGKIELFKFLSCEKSYTLQYFWDQNCHPHFNSQLTWKLRSGNLRRVHKHFKFFL